MSDRMAKFFDQSKLVTYSRYLSLKLDPTKESTAQAQIYLKSNANEADLSTEEIINSVLNCLTLSNSMKFESDLKCAITDSFNAHLGYYRDFRLTTENYQKVNKMVGYVEEHLSQYVNNGIRIGRAWDEEKSLIINAVLILFLREMGNKSIDGKNEV